MTAKLTAMPEATADDLIYFGVKKFTPKIRQRIIIERLIVRTILQDLAQAGCSFALNDGEAWATEITRDPAVVMAELMATDEESLRVLPPLAPSWWTLNFVYGNDGWDVLADHSASLLLEPLLANAERIAEEIQEIAS